MPTYEYKIKVQDFFLNILHDPSGSLKSRNVCEPDICCWVIAASQWYHGRKRCVKAIHLLESLSKVGPWRCLSPGCFFKGIRLARVVLLQGAGVTQILSRWPHQTRSPFISRSLPPAGSSSLCLLAWKCAKSVACCQVWLNFLWKQWQLLIYIWSTGVAKLSFISFSILASVPFIASIFAIAPFHFTHFSYHTINFLYFLRYIY